MPLIQRTFFAFVALILLIAPSIVAAQADGCPAQAALPFLPGMSGQVTAGASNRLRSTPSLAGDVVSEIPGGTTVYVLDTPRCADGFRWWRVVYNGVMGWTAEGSSSGYFLAVSDEQPTPPPPSYNTERQVAAWGYGTASDVAWSPDGAWLAVGSTAGVWLYSASDWDDRDDVPVSDDTPEQALHELADVTGIAFDPASAATLAVATGDGLLQLVDLNSGTREDWYRFYGGLTDVRFSHDGTLLAAMARGRVYVWDRASRELLQIFLSATDNLLTTYALSNDGTRIALGRSSGAIQVFDVRSGALLRDQFSYNPDLGLARARALAFSPDGTKLLGSDENGHVRLWSLDSDAYLEFERPYQGDPWTPVVNELTFLPDGRFLSAEDTSGLLLWTADSELVIESAIIVREVGDARIMALSPDGSRVAAIMRSNSGRVQQIHVKDIATLDLLTWIEVFGAGGNMTLNATGDILAVAQGNHQVLLTDAATGDILSTVNLPDAQIDQLTFSPDGRWMAVCINQSWYDYSPEIWVYDVSDTPSRLNILSTYVGGGDALSCRNLQFSADGAWLIIDAYNGLYAWDTVSDPVLLLDYQTTDIEIGFTVMDDQVVVAHAHSLRSYALTTTPDGEPALSPQESWELPVETTIWGTAFNSEAQRTALWMGDDRRLLSVYDVSGEPVLVNEIPADSTLRTFEFSSDGQWLAAGFQDGKILVWDVASGAVDVMVGQTAAYPVSLAFSHDSTQLYSTAADGLTRVWSLE